MANYAPCKSNTKADPNYPFHSCYNEKGEIVYSIPMEAPEDRTADEPNEIYESLPSMLLSYGPGRKIRVCFFESTDRETAYMQRAWINTLCSQERRYEEHFRSSETLCSTESGESVWDYFPAMRRNDDGYTVADYSDLPEQIEAIIRAQFKNSDLYLQVYRLSGNGLRPKQIAEKLGIDQAMVYFYRNEAWRIAQEYRKHYFDEGQYVYPKPEHRKHKKEGKRL